MAVAVSYNNFLFFSRCYTEFVENGNNIKFYKMAGLKQEV